MMHLMFKSAVPLFVKCLASLPNLHTLEVSWANERITGPLEKALKHIELPRIQTLVIPPAAHPLLRHCHDIEDLVCVVRYTPTFILSDTILSSLASNRDSKVKRLTISLVSWSNLSRKRSGALGSLRVESDSPSPTPGFVAACPKLTEFTIIWPHLGITEDTKTGYIIGQVGSVRSATSELVNACKALPDFDTFQIVYGCRPWYNEADLRVRWRRRGLREQVDSAKDLAINCLRELETGCREGEGRKKTMVRVVELDVNSRCPNFHLDSVRVEECEV